MATVYLHVGLPKTGTTALQRFLWDNEEALLRHGISYPHMEYKYKGVGFYRNGHFLLAPFVDADGKQYHDRPCREFDEAMDKVQALSSQCEKIILSDEIIWRTRWKWENYWEKIRDAFAARGLKVKVIVYLRRQDLWTESFWAQMVKGGGSTHTFAEFLELFLQNTCYVDYYDYMNHLSPILGRENLIIRIYERGQFHGKEGTLHSDFLDLFGLSLDGFQVEGEIQNTRMDGAYLELRRILNGIQESGAGRKVIQDSLYAAQTEDPLEGHFSYFTPEGKRAYMERFEKDNEKLAREYLGREDGVLFFEPLAPDPRLCVTDRQLLEAAVRAYGHMADQLAQENKALRTELKKQLKTEVRQVKSDVRSLREDVIWYRLKRKARHVFGKEDGEKNHKN